MTKRKPAKTELGRALLRYRAKARRAGKQFKSLDDILAERELVTPALRRGLPFGG